MELVDTHCHIQSIGLNKGEKTTRQLWAKANLDAETVINNAISHGVTRLICVGCDIKDSQLAVEFAQTHTNCWASIGIHPHEAKQYADQPEQINRLVKLADDLKTVAIGECGLDYYYTHSPRAAQIKVLKHQIDIAISKDLPIIFHVREAFKDFWPILNQYSNLRGVLHSYTDNKENLNEALKRGLYIGVNGIATFTKSQAQLDVYKSVPLSNLLLETDAPFLTPAPYRGKINEPMRVGEVADFMAKLRHEERSKLAEATTSNAMKLFGIE